MSEVASGLTIYSLVCHRHVDMALTCLGSLLRFSSEPIQLVIHDDGSLTLEDVERLQDGLNGAKIFSRSEADELMNQRLNHHPRCYKYRYEQAYALKLLDIPLLHEGDIAFCDSDILFFQPFSGLLHWNSPETSAIFMMDSRQAYSVHPRCLIGKNKLSLPSKINVGLIFLRKQAYDLDFIEWFLDQEEFRYSPGWIEQTCWAALGHRVGCRLWHPRQIALMHSGIKISDELVAGHFTSRVRYLLKEGIAKINSVDQTRSPIRVETILPSDCNPFDLAQSQIRRHLGEMKHDLLKRLAS